MSHDLPALTLSDDILAEAQRELLTIRDWIRFCVSSFRGCDVHIGHGTSDPFAEASAPGALLFRPVSKNGMSDSTSCVVTGRRNARRARFVAMRCAQARSSFSLAVCAGRQMNKRCRLDVSDTPGELNGPTTCTPSTSRGIRSPRLNRSPGRLPTNSSDSTRARSMNVTATSRTPDFT